ncbi:MAG: sulfotransferase domain-containing protein [Rubrimonas sp.]|uniref:sulfotransferase domain-containing protein n=1 Tax=Rubrimonas sp. TaxID=2036015 RepID=UPI002FDDDEAF
MGIVWIVSYPKSGNTWVRLFLRAFAAIRAGAAPTRLLAARSPFEASDADGQWFQPFLKRPIADCALDEIAAVRPRAQAAIAASRPADMFVKCHHFLGVERGTPTIAGEVTRAAIVAVRDPRDVAVSYRGYLGMDADAVIDHMLNPAALTDRMNGAYWALGSWGAHVDSWTINPPRGVVLLRYEDMLADPKRAFGGMLTALGVQFRPVDLRKAVEATAFARLRAEEGRAGFSETPGSTERFFRKGASGGWREALSEAQARRLTEAFGPTMARLGYEV